MGKEYNADYFSANQKKALILKKKKLNEEKIWSISDKKSTGVLVILLLQASATAASNSDKMVELWGRLTTPAVNWKRFSMSDIVLLTDVEVWDSLKSVIVSYII